MTKEYSICEPETTADASVIWLHGLGADGSDFMGVVDQLGLPKNHSVRFVFPNAPFRAITVNHGMNMRGWYDIFDLNLLRKEDETGILESEQLILDLMKHEMAQGIRSERIILAGFSQGGAMALYTGLRCLHTIAGIIVLSAYLPLTNTFAAYENPKNRDTPIFIAHGMFDPVVPLHAGKSSSQFLIDHKYNVTWKTYPIAHTVSFDEINDIGTFIRECLGYA